MMLICGGTGAIGAEVTRQLIAAGQRPRVFVRGAEKAKRFEGKVDLALGDLSDAAALDAAMKGVERVFLLATGPEMVKLEAGAIAAAKRAGVGHVVLLSVAGAEGGAIRLGRWHREGELALIDAKIPYTILRPVNFMSNALEWAATIKAQGSIFLPAGSGRAAYIDPADVGAVAVKALLSGAAHIGKEYVLTGPESLSTADLAALFAKALGRPVQHVDVPADAFAKQLLQFGLPQEIVAAFGEMYEVLRAGGLAFATPTVEEVLGRKPATFQSWLERNLAAFR
jgi:uncharacterized protein YbjT (DUF2867 family)